MTDKLSEVVAHANQTIIGLPAGPWDLFDEASWPTEGYDGPLVKHDWEAAETQPGNPFAMTGYTRDEWLALADEMIARWAAWKAQVLAAGPP